MEGGWDAFFDEHYLRTYEPFLTEERRIVHRAYSVTELAEMLRSSGFGEVECFGDWEGAGPPSAETRLLVRAR